MHQNAKSYLIQMELGSRGVLIAVLGAQAVKMQSIFPFLNVHVTILTSQILQSNFLLHFKIPDLFQLIQLFIF